MWRNVFTTGISEMKKQTAQSRDIILVMRSTWRAESFGHIIIFNALEKVIKTILEMEVNGIEVKHTFHRKYNEI